MPSRGGDGVQDFSSQCLDREFLSLSEGLWISCHALNTFQTDFVVWQLQFTNHSSTSLKALDSLGTASNISNRISMDAVVSASMKACFHVFSCCSQLHRMVEVGGASGSHLVQPFCSSTAIYRRPDHVRVAFEDLQGGKLHKHSESNIYASAYSPPE